MLTNKKRLLTIIEFSFLLMLLILGFCPIVKDANPPSTDPTIDSGYTLRSPALCVYYIAYNFVFNIPLAIVLILVAIKFFIKNKTANNVLLGITTFLNLYLLIIFIHYIATIYILIPIIIFYFIFLIGNLVINSVEIINIFKYKKT